jgi:hypothetical protein
MHDEQNDVEVRGETEERDAQERRCGEVKACVGQISELRVKDGERVRGE